MKTIRALLAALLLTGTLALGVTSVWSDQGVVYAGDINVPGKPYPINPADGV